MRFFIFAAGLICISQWAGAQIDMASEMLLRPAQQQPDEAGLESGRYKVKKSAKGPASNSDDMSIRLKKVKSLPGKKVSGSEVNLEKDLGQSTSVVVGPNAAATTSTTLKASASDGSKTSEATTSTSLAGSKSSKASVVNTSSSAGAAAKNSQVSATTNVSGAQSSDKTAKKSETEMGKILFSQPAPDQTAATATAGAVSAAVTKTEENETTVLAADPEPSVGDQFRDMVLGTGSDVVEAYKEQVHPDDIRINRIEVTVAPGVISNQSKSGYSYRNYNTFSPKVSLGANFWLTPFMGLYGDYTTSMGSDVISDPSEGSRVSAQHEWTEIGFDIRKFFGMSRKSNSLQFGIHMSEYKFTVPGDEAHRVNLRSSGIGVHLLTRIPVAPSYSWVFGGKLIPRVQHTELATGIDLSSGQGGESTRVDLMIGGEFKLARQNQIVWNFTSSFEKNQFNGQANLIDPERGSAPKGVSVENGFYLFSLGYRWGQ